MKKTLEDLVCGLSFGGRYFAASLVYIGLSFILIASMPEIKVAFASEDGCAHTVTVTDENGTHEETRPGCPDGQLCCGSSCISSGQGCCNGSSYDTSTENCCSGVIYSISSQGCCGGNVYDRETEKCCCESCVKLLDECCCDCDACTVCD
jgi:hypothetical protein